MSKLYKQRKSPSLSLQVACKSAVGVPGRQEFKKVLDCFASGSCDLLAALTGRRTGVCIRIVSKEESQQLNRDFRQQDKPTNVLSFPFDEPDYLGDLALCHEIIAAEAEAQGKTLLAHYQHMTLHGILHLLGYDHETEAEAVEMEALEIKLLAQLGVKDPYHGH